MVKWEPWTAYRLCEYSCRIKQIHTQALQKSIQNALTPTQLMNACIAQVSIECKFCGIRIYATNWIVQMFSPLVLTATVIGMRLSFSLLLLLLLLCFHISFVYCLKIEHLENFAAWGIFALTEWFSSIWQASGMRLLNCQSVSSLNSNNKNNNNNNKYYTAGISIFCLTLTPSGRLFT